MPRRPLLIAAMLVGFASGPLGAAEKLADVPYREGGRERHVLDVYRPRPAAKAALPVVVWIHGGGWQGGDKSDVGIKPRVLTERGFVFVSTNYRLLPEVGMEDLIGDVAAAVGWVHRHIAEHGGDPARIIVGGHSAGAQLAALLCTDHRYLGREGVPTAAICGCVPVDGDTYDVPKIILTAEHRQAIYGGKMPTFGHRQKFGNDPVKHVDFSAVTHVAADKAIPPFLILFFAGNPDTNVQARRLESVLVGAGHRATAVGSWQTNHDLLNAELGKPGAVATGEFLDFLEACSRPANDEPRP
jgi:arylformamidase